MTEAPPAREEEEVERAEIVEQGIRVERVHCGSARAMRRLVLAAGCLRYLDECEARLQRDLGRVREQRAIAHHIVAETRRRMDEDERRRSSERALQAALDDLQSVVDEEWRATVREAQAEAEEESLVDAATLAAATRAAAAASAVPIPRAASAARVAAAEAAAASEEEESEDGDGEVEQPDEELTAEIELAGWQYARLVSVQPRAATPIYDEVCEEPIYESLDEAAARPARGH